MIEEMIGGRGGRMLRIWAAQGHRCGLCSNPMPPFHPRNRRHGWTMDHVWPRRYYFGTQGNVLVAHGKCNRRKGDRDPTGCELIILAVVNAKLGHELRVSKESVLELREAA